MLQVTDSRASRVHQESLAEGEKKGLAHAIVKLAAKKMPAEEIAAILEIETEFVREVLNSLTNG